MRNESKIKKILILAEKLPFFTFNDLATVEKNKIYLKIIFSRYKKKNKLISLKRGIYTTKEYLNQTEKKDNFSSYLKFLANNLYSPSYLSLDYILYLNNILTEIPVNFTSISKRKTKTFSNKLGNFIYHKIKDELFIGFNIIKEGNYILFKATKAKALFDFLYLRKTLLINKKSIEELRLNLDNFKKKDLKEFRRYVKKEKSKRMEEISNCLFK